MKTDTGRKAWITLGAVMFSALWIDTAVATDADDGFMMMRLGLGPGECASLGLNADAVLAVRMRMNAATSELATIATLEGEKSTLEHQIRNGERLLRSSAARHPDQVMVVANARTRLAEVVSELRIKRDELREIALGEIPVTADVIDRICDPRGQRRELPPAWRAGSPASELGELKDALKAQARASACGETVDSETSLILTTEQARPATSQALSSWTENRDSVKALFRYWLNAG